MAAVTSCENTLLAPVGNGDGQLEIEAKNKLEKRFRKNLAKLTGSAVRINSKKAKGKNSMKEKKR